MELYQERPELEKRAEKTKEEQPKNKLAA